MKTICSYLLLYHIIKKPFAFLFQLARTQLCDIKWRLNRYCSVTTTHICLVDILSKKRCRNWLFYCNVLLRLTEHSHWSYLHWLELRNSCNLRNWAGINTFTVLSGKHIIAMFAILTLNFIVVLWWIERGFWLVALVHLSCLVYVLLWMWEFWTCRNICTETSTVTFVFLLLIWNIF
jgi:hypothetical protein